MKNKDVVISIDKGCYSVKISGRANFEYAPVIRCLAKEIDVVNFKEISIDLAECIGMDSTFMGIIAMLGLKAHECNAVMNIVNANEQNKELLIGLGIDRLINFIYRDDTESTSEPETVIECSEKPEDKQLNTAECVYEAHATLMDIDEDNVAKFEKVVKYAKTDLDKLREKNDQKTDK
ncbi:STAS domain-containing protein [Lentisphaerota bacterium WC36G]|nr:STAS domain-containing protein [Lentisphaerae bacterium WC36]